MTIESVHWRHQIMGVPQHQVVLPSHQGVQNQSNEPVPERRVTNFPNWGPRYFNDVVGLTVAQNVPQLNGIVRA